MRSPSSDLSVRVFVAFMRVGTLNTDKGKKKKISLRWIYFWIFPIVAPQQQHNAVDNCSLLLLELWANIHIEVTTDGGREKKGTRETLNTAAGLWMQHYAFTQW